MSGHSKWATIKRQKARVDSARGKTFTQLSRAIIVAARSGSSDPNGNFQLRTAIIKAKVAGLPNDTIDRAIAKGAGNAGNGNQLESIKYEGYGVGGVAIIVETLTDNRNRTVADLRLAFDKRGGNLGETGCVSWMFRQKGVCTVTGKIDEENLLSTSIEGGADFYELSDDPENLGATIFTEIGNLESLSRSLQSSGFKLSDAEIRWVPENTIEITDDEQLIQLSKLIEVLESLDDVQNVTTNLE